MRTRLSTGLMIAAMAMMFAAPAHADWWRVFFPTRNMAAETLKAPFADPDAVIEAPEEGSVLALNVQHRPNAEIVAWTQRKVSELVIYSAKTYEQEYSEKTKDLDEAGRAEYLKFLQDNNILKPLSTGTYDIKGFSQDMPNILNQGALAGRYRWLLQVPVMVTFVPTGLTDYKTTKDAEMITTQYIVNLQVGRSSAAGNELGLMIESWKATPVTIKPPEQTQ